MGEYKPPVSDDVKGSLTKICQMPRHKVDPGSQCRADVEKEKVQRG